MSQRKATVSIFCTVVEFIFNSDQIWKLLIHIPPSSATDIVDIEHMLVEKNIKHLLQPVVVGKAAHRGSRQKVFKERQKAARPCQKKESFPREMRTMRQAGRQQKMLGESRLPWKSSERVGTWSELWMGT